MTITEPVSYEIWTWDIETKWDISAENKSGRTAVEQIAPRYYAMGGATRLVADAKAARLNAAHRAPFFVRTVTDGKKKEITTAEWEAGRAHFRAARERESAARTSTAEKREQEKAEREYARDALLGPLMERDSA